MQQSLASIEILRWRRAYNRKQTAAKGNIMKRVLTAKMVFCAGIVIGKVYIVCALNDIIEVELVSA